MSLKIVQLTAPNFWASYLIDGDSSGMEGSEIASCDAWISAEGMGDPVDCEECGFCHWHDAREFALPGDCAVYTFLVEEQGR